MKYTNNAYSNAIKQQNLAECLASVGGQYSVFCRWTWDRLHWICKR